ncbi:TetR/AcrR family transcriptional regulator [Fodinicola feengrottensis]|uniref:TetR/AcrR family transcriptional regulator n=1 Tax=Fodinicola feengrottensis TaxID=435914 RepID=UPI0031D87188
MRSPRERYREQVRDEVKAHAWRQVATTGATALSLNAIAKQMGVSGPALYRYFASRDELITALILDAYRDLSTAGQAAAAAAKTPAAQLAAIALAIREWALAEPHRYLLIYGTPVPGYVAPTEATTLAASLMALLLDAFADIPSTPGSKSATALEKHLATHRDWAGNEHAGDSALHRALAFWTRVHGVLSLELAGHFVGMAFDPALLYAAEVDAAITENAEQGRGRPAPAR